MNLIGKIFTVLILVLSIMFMAFSVMVFATHRNWRRIADNAQPGPGEKPGYKQQLEALQTKKKEADDLLQKLKNEYAQEQAARKAALASLQVRTAKAEADLATKQQELNTVLAQHGEAVKTADLAQTRLAALEEETKKLRDELRGVQADLHQKFIAVVDLTDKLIQAESVRQNLDERNKEALIQISQMKQVLDSRGLTADALVAHIPPKVEGVVLAFDRDLVEISIGADDGLKVGHALDLFRDNSYLGRIVIRRTDPDRAVGQVVRELQKGQIQRGDRVTSKFN